MKTGAVVATLMLALGSPVTAQGPGFQLAHLFTDPSATGYRLDFSTPLLGPVGIGPALMIVDGGTGFGNLWGGGLDLSLFHGGRTGLYAIGGVDGGLVTKGGRTFWGSWSVGLGYEVYPFAGLSLAAEGRFRRIDPRNYHGMQVGIRLGLDRGSKRGGAGGRDGGSGGGNPNGSAAGASVPSSLSTAAILPPADAPPDSSGVREDLDRSGVPADRASVLTGVVQTALDVMGMPYRWGDEGEEGFDCSGLIRYAFGKQGITLPRRSRDQAREGEPVEKNLDSLQPGDILTFSRSGGKTVSHVGLYVGNGKFIHSARQGVQLSVLSPDDVSGRWWYRRWVGARRLRLQ
jgi:cell wall-associated NlpC family hydrolase